MKTLVANFSVEFGKTAEIAKAFAEAAGAELFEIVPEEPYTKKDLRYTNPLARCNVEKIRKKDVPVAGKVPNWDDTIPFLLDFQSGMDVRPM